MEKRFLICINLFPSCEIPINTLGIIGALSGHYPGIIRALSARVSGLAGYSKCTVGQCITTARPVPGETSPLGWSAVVNVLQTLMKLRFDRSPELKNFTFLWHITLCTPCAPLCPPCARPVHTLCTPCAHPVHAQHGFAFSGFVRIIHVSYFLFMRKS